MISVIIPCRNEEAFIVRCLESIWESGFPTADMEILVADGASTDRTRELIEAFSHTHANVILIDNPDRSVPVGLNRMLRVARGEYILRFDAHSVMPKGYIQSCVKVLKREEVWCAGGVCVTRPRGPTAMAGAIAMVTSHWFGVGGSTFRTGHGAGPVDTVPFGAFRHSVFEDIGLFDERLVRNQDNEFTARIRKSGGTVWLSPDVKIIYYNQATLKGLIIQALNTGKWNVITLRLAPHAVRARHLLPGLFSVGVGVAALCVTSGCILPGAAIVAPYFAVLIAVCLSLRPKVPRRQAVLLPWVFFWYHFCYGIGILHGCVLALTGVWGRQIPLHQGGSAGGPGGMSGDAP